MIAREKALKAIHETYAAHSICALVGPRQCGKTTLAYAYAKSQKGNFYAFDLEDPTDLAQLKNPKLTLEPLDGLILIDEIQRSPSLFPYLRVLADKYPQRQLLLLGSASPAVIRQSSESLAGRVGHVELAPFSLDECSDMPTLWKRGGFPRSFLASSDAASLKWRKSYISTFLERDLAALGFNLSPHEMRKLWTMLAHYHGSIVNYSELGRSLGLSDTTIRRYIQILEGAFMIRMLPPWHANVKKRQIKSPKVYLRDSGLLHALLGMDDTFPVHPKIGASWEGLAIESLIKYHEADREDCYFWATQNQAELDLLIVKDGKRFAFECKYTDHPSMTRSMHSAINDLNLDLITTIVPGDVNFWLSENVRVIGLKQYKNAMEGNRPLT